VTSTIWAAIGAHLVDQRFGSAAVWAVVAAAASSAGIIHGFEVRPTGPVETLGFGSAGWAIPACYAALALIFALQAVPSGPFRSAPPASER